ncbi:MAG: GumC family protein [Pirellulales bacterium]
MVFGNGSVPAHRNGSAGVLRQVNSPITPGLVLHAVRHWWKLALPAGLVLAGVSATLVWFCMEPVYKAAAWLRIQDQTPYIAFPDRPDSSRFVNAFVQTQMEILRSPRLIAQVLETRAVAQLPEVLKQESPIEWLTKELTVKPVGQSEFVEVSFTGPDPASAAKIVNAVQDAYIAIQRQSNNEQSMGVIDLLDKQQASRGKELEQLRDKVRQLTKQATGNDAILPEASGGRMTVQTPVAALEQRLITAEVEREILEAQMKVFQDSIAKQKIEVSPDIVEKALVSAPEVVNLKTAIANRQASLHQLEVVAVQKDGRRSLALRKEIADYENALKKLEGDLRPKIIQEAERSALAERQGALADMQTKVENQRLLENLLKERLKQQATKNEDVGGQTAELAFAQSELARADKVYELIASRVVTLRTELNAPERVSIYQSAMVPTKPEKTPYKVLAAVALAGLCFPFFLAVVRERFVRRINESQQLRQETDLHVVGEIATMPGRSILFGRNGSGRYERQRSTFEESIDHLRTSLVLADELKNVKVLVVASAVSREGKTSIASQLAVSLARACHEPVLLMDGDMRAPDIHQVFEIAVEPGLANVLDQQCSASEAIVTTWSKLVHLMPAGRVSKSPHVLLGNGAFRALLDEVRPLYRYIIVDAPPVLSASEALVLSKAADGTLICTMRDVSRGPQVRAAYERLIAAGARPVGAVLSGIPVNSYASKYGTSDYPMRSTSAQS